MILALSIAALCLSAIPAVMFLVNLPLFRSIADTNHRSPTAETSTISVLIPARDEAGGIGQCVRNVLESTQVELEVVVLNDHSTDETASIVTQIAQEDRRVRLVHGAELPEGWNGKQHACKQLADAAAYDTFVFLDADVRLSNDALDQLNLYRQKTDVGLLSAFPNQLTGTWLEKWLIPMMHYVLLGFLPFARMRSHDDASLAAGCGQLFLTTRQAYLAAGTHEAIKSSRHDGIKLPRAYRTAGMMTDVVDGTELATCRMYVSSREVVRGVLKNAIEGIANPRLILVFTVLLLGASLLPMIAMAVAMINRSAVGAIVSLVAIAVSHLPRFVAAKKLKQSWWGAVCHVPATVTFLVLQWVALVNYLLGRQIAWRGRSN